MSSPPGVLLKVGSFHKRQSKERHLFGTTVLCLSMAPHASTAPGTLSTAVGGCLRYQDCLVPYQGSRVVSSHHITQTTLATLPTLEQDQLTPSWLDTKARVNQGSQFHTAPGPHAPPTMQPPHFTVTIQPTRATSRIITAPPLAIPIPDLHMKAARTRHHI